MKYVFAFPKDEEEGRGKEGKKGGREMERSKRGSTQKAADGIESATKDKDERGKEN